jgi:hypothetical protein
MTFKSTGFVSDPPHFLAATGLNAQGSKKMLKVY